MMERLEMACLDPKVLQSEIYPDLSREWFTTPDWDLGLYAEAARAGMISVTWQPGLDTWLLAQLQTEYAVLDWDNRHLPRRLFGQLRRSQPLLASASLVLTTSLGPVIEGIRNRYFPECWLTLPYARLIQDLAEAPLPGCQPMAIELRGPQGELWAGELGYTTGPIYTCLSGFVAPLVPAGVSWGTVQILALSQVLAKNGYCFMNMGHTEQSYKLALGARILTRADFLCRWLAARDGAVSAGQRDWSPPLPMYQPLPIVEWLRQIPSTLNG